MKDIILFKLLTSLQTNFLSFSLHHKDGIFNKNKTHLFLPHNHFKNFQNQKNFLHSIKRDFKNQKINFNKNIININFDIYKHDIWSFLHCIIEFLIKENFNVNKIIIIFNDYEESKTINFLNNLNDQIILFKQKHNYVFKHFILTSNALVNDHPIYIYFPFFYYYFNNTNYTFFKKSTEHTFDLFFKYKKNKRTFLFCSLNREVRHHRIAFLYHLKKINFKNEYLISFNQIKNFNFSNYYHINQDELKKIKTPIVLDEKKSRLEFTNTINNYFYLSSFLSQINETFEGNDHLFITEKTFKPILKLSPFIVFGNSGTLKELNKWGFETNFRGIDSQYDNEKNSYLRLQMILSEIKKLDLSKKDLLDFYHNNREILIYNYNRYLELNENDILEKTNFKNIINCYESL